MLQMDDQDYNPLVDGPSISIPKGWTVWDIINIKGPMTCQEFIDFFKKECNVKILGISSNKKQKLPLKIEDIYAKNNGLKKDQKSLRLEISADFNNISVIMPKIKYTFK